MTDSRGQFIVINDVGPRDGLQNQPEVLDPEKRLQLIEALLAAGVKHIEVGAFVSSKAVPAMAGAGEILAGLRGRMDDADTVYTVLVPNVKGYELALASGARSVCMVLYGSEGMARSNVRMSRGEAEQAAMEILQRARADGIRVVSTIAVAFECPFDGAVDPLLVQDTATRFLELGSDELCIADTIGGANPRQVRSMMDTLAARHGPEKLSCHFHDTRAMGLANVYAAVESGIRKFDTSIAGLGGCPFAPGASGNVATEDVVMMLEQMGFATGIGLPALLDAVALARNLTGTAPGGRAMAWLQNELQKPV